jgi:uncharacterized protein YozE (UPF0346 family)
MAILLALKRKKIGMTKRVNGFYKWAKKQATRNDDVGWITKDIKDDPDFPKYFVDYKELFKYLLYMGASDNAFIRLRLAIKEYNFEKENIFKQELKTTIKNNIV